MFSQGVYVPLLRLCSWGVRSPHFPHLGPILRALRHKRSITQEALAEGAGIDYKHYQLVEGGRAGFPSLAILHRIAKVLHVKPWVLLCDDLKLVSTQTGLTSQELADAAKPAKGRPKGSVKKPE